MSKEVETQERTDATKVRQEKTEAEFVKDLTTKEEAKPDKLGKMTVSGAFPQVLRKAFTDKVGMFKRVSY